MTYRVGRLVVYLIVGFLSHSQGLHFTLDSTPDTFYCGHLTCSVDVNQNDALISAVVEMSVYSIDQPNILTRLASISVFHPEVQVESTKVRDLNVTGSVSNSHANLNLSLRNKTDCLMVSFLCELDFMSVSGTPDVIKDVVTPVTTDNCHEIFNQLANMTDKLETHSNEVSSQLTEVRSQNAATKQELVRLETKLDSVLRYLSRLGEVFNISQSTDVNLACLRGAPNNETRKKFLLWGGVPALCDTETDGGGWVIIQRRTKGDVYFNRGWDDYKKGFGTPDTDYWLGNDNIHNLTSQGYNNLRVDMEYQGVKYFAEYSNFSVSDEISNYKLTVGGYHGNATDQLNYNSDMSFSTFDRDNDLSNSNCSGIQQGGWWCKDCSYCNLNGLWASNSSWLFWQGVVYLGSVTWSEMKVRQV